MVPQSPETGDQVADTPRHLVVGGSLFPAIPGVVSAEGIQTHPKAQAGLVSHFARSIFAFPLTKPETAQKKRENYRSETLHVLLSTK